MGKIKLNILILTINCVLIILLMLSHVRWAFADNICNKSDALCTSTNTTALDIGGGSLALTTASPGQFNYDLGNATLPTSTLPITVNDRRGTGAGWTVSVTITQFRGEDNPSHTLPETGTAFFTAMSPACTQNTDCSLPDRSSCSISSPLPIKMDGTTPTSLCNSGPNAGMGEIVLNPTITLTIPGSAFADIYTGSITVTVTSDV